MNLPTQNIMHRTRQHWEPSTLTGMNLPTQENTQNELFKMNKPKHFTSNLTLSAQTKYDKSQSIILYVKQTGNSALTQENVPFTRTTQSRRPAGFGRGSLGQMTVTGKWKETLAVFALLKETKRTEKNGESTRTREFVYAGRFFQ